MGNAFSNFFGTFKINGHKRKRESSRLHLSENEKPAKKIKLDRRHYFYNNLFLNGENSDVTIEALDKQWKLHKIFLCQSSYFNSMFNGLWIESKQDTIKIEIEDKNINAYSLGYVFGSFYLGDKDIQLDEIISVYAAANLFQIEELIKLCTKKMIETLNFETFNRYYTTAIQYCNDDLKAVIVSFLKSTILFPDFKKEDLKIIDEELMLKIVSSSNLVIFKTEMSLYKMIKSWIYFRINNSNENFCDDSDEYFNNMDTDNFLETTQGRVFTMIIKNLRLKNLLFCSSDRNFFKREKLIPSSWIDSELDKIWSSIVNINSNLQKRLLTNSLFLSTCTRISFLLENDASKIFDFKSVHPFIHHATLIYHDHRFDIKILPGSDFNCLALKLHIFSKNNVFLYKKSNLMLVRLVKFEQHEVLKIPRNFLFPLVVSVNLLFGHNLSAN